MDLTLGVKSGTVGRKLGGGWDLGSTFVGLGGAGGGGLGPRVNIWGFGSTRCSHVSPHIRGTFSPSLFVYSYRSKYVHLEISRPQQKQHLCFSRPRGSKYFAITSRLLVEHRSFFKSCKKCSLQKNYMAKIAPFPAGWVWSH